MTITIYKDEFGIKFYGTRQDPLIVIYSDEVEAMLSYISISNEKDAAEVAQAVYIAGLFIRSLKTPEAQFKTNDIETIYVNEGDASAENTKYSARKVLNWLESDKVVTVNKTKRIKYRFTKFSFENGKLIIFYKPLAW